MSQNVWASTSSIAGSVRLGSSLSWPYTTPCDNKNWYSVPLTPAGKFDPNTRFQTTPFSFPEGSVDLPTESDFVERGGPYANRVRAIVGGTIDVTDVQATLSARRNYRQYLALKTTTLGELCVAISIRATMKATVNYEDRRIRRQRFFALNRSCQPKSFEELMQGIPVRTANGTSTLAIRRGLFDWGYLAEYGTDDISYQGTWEDAEVVDTNTLTHRFCGDILMDFVLTQGQEFALAAGGEVSLYIPGFKWTLKKA